MKYSSCTDYWLDKEKNVLRGEFEQMYKDIEDPWGCYKYADSLNNKIFLEILFYKRQFKKVLDIGCGLGGFTNLLFQRNGGGIIGIDISKTAIEKAKKRYPYIQFTVGNIITDDLKERFDLIVMSEVIWYILDGIKDVFRKLYLSLECHDSVLGIHQYFPDDQKFGRDIINGLEGFETFIKKETDFAFKNKVISFGESEGRVLLATLKPK